jgi:hypothetical protein
VAWQQRQYQRQQCDAAARKFIDEFALTCSRMWSGGGLTHTCGYRASITKYAGERIYSKNAGWGTDPGVLVVEEIH